MTESNDWISRLSGTFVWSENEPGPDQVVREAKRRDVSSIDHLIERMEDANGINDRVSRVVEERLSENENKALSDAGGPEATTGYQRWKWYRNYRDAFLGEPSDEE